MSAASSMRERAVGHVDDEILAVDLPRDLRHHRRVVVESLGHSKIVVAIGGQDEVLDRGEDLPVLVLAPPRPGSRAARGRSW